MIARRAPAPRAVLTGCLVATLALASACAKPPPEGGAAALPGPATAIATALPTPAPGPPRTLLLVTVGGLEAQRFQGAQPEMPVLAGLAEAGIAVERLEPPAPAAAYPAHTTLVTGVPPALHGIAADRTLGDRGVRPDGYPHSSQVAAPTLWQEVGAARRPVASFDWPATVGARIAILLPDLAPRNGGRSWQQQLTSDATADVAQVALAASAAAGEPGLDRDALLLGLTCQVMTRPAPPALVLLRLRAPEVALEQSGPGSAAARDAFARTDGQLGQLVGCLATQGALPGSALVVAGDRAFGPVHTALRPNVWLAQAGLLATGSNGRLTSWKAIARANGRSAFVYATDERAALDARERLVAEAAETGAFRVLSAREMIDRGADRQAWFGVEAHPGYVFEDDVTGAPLAAARARGAAGQLSSVATPEPALVAWGSGLRRGLQVPELAELDVAPTLAALLQVDLPGAVGHVVPGLLAEAPVAP